MSNLIAFQGAHGAHSELACNAAMPAHRPLPCATFEDAFAAVRDEKAQLAMIPVENLIGGRVADVHTLLPKGGLHIIGEHYQPIEHCLLALPGVKVTDLKEAISHPQGVAQCKLFLKEHNLKGTDFIDTAAAAQHIAETKDTTRAAIASAAAAKHYGLEILATNIADLKKNVTRFLILSRTPKIPPEGKPAVITFVFRVRSVPAALYKALGGFATNGVNLTKIESYLVDGQFSAAQFYVDVEAHPAEKRWQLALEELQFFASEVRILGSYPAHAFRVSP